MTATSRTITIETLNGTGRFDTYVAQPAGTPRAAIVVIQEIFGVNAGIRNKCDRLAADGYLALAPDLFWQIAPGVELDPDVPDQMQRALSLMGEFDQDAGIRDIEATIRTARSMLNDVHQGDGLTSKVGVVGYCLGGRLAFMTAARTDVDASVGYYGVGIDGLLGEAHAIAHPVLLHIPQEDHFVDKDAQARMHAGLDDHAKVTLFDYPGEDHGFATEFGQRRSDESAQLADQRTASFFAAHLG
ncbi:dienelactone hydrolase family protein [Sphingomonas sp. S6]|jgi:carboxymethylenebutenolidase|uniref:dienelactone hydrolase family protein n=1 Tax=Sphingomonas sp. S6 TaxID=3368600 RepID=UPI000FBB1067|nr:dienelactone hydrolase family protein [uncultured Sphingomonas sp.]RTL17061.1 MAG: dienelactone hydrolase family protein [Sphingomonadaceae bacterium]